jgi:hypothetical protein
MIILKNKQFKINIHLVEHQVFYTPIYLCEQDGYEINYVVEKSKSNDRELVQHLFSDDTSNKNEIDIYLTGGPDITTYLTENPDAPKSKVYFWMTVVNRLPVQLLVRHTKRSSDSDGIYSFRNFTEPPITHLPKIYSPPKNTTLNYFISKYYDKAAFEKDYLKGNDEDTRKIKAELKKKHSIFNGKLFPANDFDEIIKNIKSDNELAFAFGISFDEEVRKIKKIAPPMEIIAFTCIYAKNDIWNDEEKRKFLDEFCSKVKHYIDRLHEFEKFYEKNSAGEYSTKELMPALKVFFKKRFGDIEKLKQEQSEDFNKLAQIFVTNLKYLAQYRSFAVDLQSVLELRVGDLNSSKDKIIHDPYHKFKLYYWIGEGYVINANKAIIEDAAHKLKSAFILAGVSSVIARNLSHNIGSHVLPEYRNFYNNVFKNNASLSPSSEEDLKAYFDYTQNRMELLADITISQKNRVPFRYSSSDLIGDFQKYIKNIGLGLFDAFKDKLKNKVQITIDTNTFDCYIFLPGGQLGVSAFNVVIENILRNYSKHSSSTKNNSYYFGIHLSEAEIEELKDEYWCVDIFDRHGKQNPTRNLQLLKTLQKYIDDSVLDDNNSLRKKGWGFIEMKATASYLINYPLSKIDKKYEEEFIKLEDRVFPAKLIEAGYYDIKDGAIISRFTSRTKRINSGNLNLGYRFYLKKAKSLLIQKSILNANQLNKIGQYKNQGVNIAEIQAENFKRTEHEIVISNSDMAFSNQRSVNIELDPDTNSDELIRKAWLKYVSLLDNRELNIIPLDSDKIDKNKINIAIDDHGKDLGLRNATLTEILNKKYYRYFVKSSSEFDAFPTDAFYYPERIKEAALLSISVFDERIQNDVLVYSSNQPNLTYRDIHELGGVFIPYKFYSKNNLEKSVNIDLDKVKINNKKEKRQFADSFIKRLKTDDFVIVHFTLFEKIVPKQHTAQSYFESFTPHLRKKIVFCSGMGKPSNLVNNCFYLNLSTLQNLLVNKPSKFSLVNTLKAL